MSYYLDMSFVVDIQVAGKAKAGSEKNGRCVLPIRSPNCGIMVWSTLLPVSASNAQLGERNSSTHYRNIPWAMGCSCQVSCGKYYVSMYDTMLGESL